MSNSNLSEREREVLELIAEDSGSSVGELGRRLGVSPVSVRGLLNSLAEKGFIVRTWGGAFPSFHPEMLERQRQRMTEKNRIAKAAAALVKDGDTIMVEAGTTTALVLKYLFGRRDVFVVSNSSLVVPYARANPGIQLTLVGGSFRPATESLERTYHPSGRGRRDSQTHGRSRGRDRAGGGQFQVRPDRLRESAAPGQTFPHNQRHRPGRKGQGRIEGKQHRDPAGLA
jgi:predicted transcriptional regulator